MRDPATPFSNHLLPFVATTLVSHRNPATCVLCGMDRPLVVRAEGQRIEGDMVVIRPGVEHSVEIGGRARVLYFDGLPFPFHGALADRIPRQISSLTIDALGGDAHAQRELRLRFATRETTCSPRIASIIEDIVNDPMLRMSQAELAGRLGIERTRALRAFKAATRMTFRGFKNWVGLQAAAQHIARGELVRTAAMDAGFSDSAHLARAFRLSFGTTPSEATADRRARS
jgi:AraC-like DNA-binding protein